MRYKSHSTEKKNNYFSRFLIICAVLLLLILPQTASAAGEQGAEIAVDPVNRSDNYSAVMYDNTNGLPTAEANDIAQTSEGFIWIGCYAGLVRYDGNTFERMDSTTGVGSVACLHADEKDRLWIGTNDCGIAVMENGKYRFWDEKDGLGSDKVRDLEEDENGVIYAGTTAGIDMFTPDLKHEHIDDPKIADAYIDRILAGNDGLVYCTTNNEDLFILRDGKLEEYYDHETFPIKGMTSVYPDPEAPGKVYIGTEDSGIYYGEISSMPDKARHYNVDPLFSVIYMHKYGNQLWICSRNGIGLIEDGSFHYMDNLPLNNSVYYVMKDYQGNLWFISTRQGLMKLVPNRFSDLYTRYNLPPNVVNSTCIHDGKLFVGTDTGLTVLGDEGPLKSLPLKSVTTASGEAVNETDLIEMLKDCRIRSVIRDSSNRLWISTWKYWGLIRYDDGNVTLFNTDSGLHSDHIRAVCEAQDGSIIVAETGGLSVINGDRITASYGRDEGIANDEVLTVCSAPNGDILAGSNGGGIYVINGEGIRCIDKKDGLMSGIIMRIKYDEKRGLYWIVAGNSIAYMTEDYKVSTIHKFPYPDNMDMYENSKGDMWILSSDGIYVIPAEELIANKEIDTVHYGISNGLPFVVTSNSYSELTDEGDLYISGRAGVAKVNIDSSMENVSSIRVSVPFVDADGKMIYADQYGAFTIPSTTKKLTIHAHVYDYSLTDPEVSYRLIGFDRKKETLKRSELAPVSYTNLSGGSYRFQMELKDAMGRGRNSISVAITKQKALHEQSWFYILVGSCAALILYFVIREYIRRKMAAMEAKHREEAALERVSNELQMANQIQNSMLPHEFPPFPDRSEFDIYAVMDPAREVGGDFYDFYFIDDDLLCLIIADVSGKGIPAALFMMNSKVTLKGLASSGKTAAEILSKANDAIIAENQMEMFVTVWMGILDVSSGRLTAANAGHEYPVLKRADGSFELFKDKHGLVIGAMEGIKYKDYEIQLRPGDKLFVYTDGVPEATDTENNMFGTERMLSALNSEPDSPPQKLLENVRGAVDSFTGDAEQFDDLTMLCIEYKGKEQ